MANSAQMNWNVAYIVDAFGDPYVPLQNKKTNLFISLESIYGQTHKTTNQTKDERITQGLV
jgi:hypothetical protein